LKRKTHCEILKAISLRNLPFEHLKVDLVKNAIGLMALLLLYSCKDQNGNKGKTPNSAVNSYPAATSTLTPSELRHYKTVANSFFDSMLGRGRFNGSILVAKNGEIIYEQYQGFRNPRIKKDSITPSTSFHLASVSKTITAMAVLKLAEEGKLNIEDSVSKYLAGFPCAGVTIKTLLNHRSGLPNYVHYMEKLGWDKKRLITNQDVLNFIIERHKDIDIGAPDRRFSYSNTNYALLALVIEKATGQFYGDYLRQTFFEPLGMKDTYVFTPADSAKSLPSFFYSGRQYAFDFLDLVYGDKNIYSTVRDLLKWDQALHSGRLFKKETLDAAYAGYSFERPGVNNYGLGWRMFLLRNGKKFIYHNGWWHGNRTAFYRLIDENVTIIALSNNDSKKVYSSKKLADMFGNYFKNKEEAKETENTGGGSPTP
jgi:CubicO group peptidase (beta-lactamase class C family)